jgi:hypothetical protein
MVIHFFWFVKFVSLFSCFFDLSISVGFDFVGLTPLKLGVCLLETTFDVNQPAFPAQGYPPPVSNDERCSDGI